MIKGEIRWANLPDPRRSEPGYVRPVLIIQSDIFNKSNIQTIICAVITTNTKLAKAPGNLLLRKFDSHLPKESVINISQLITIDKTYLKGLVGTLNKRIMKKVDEGLKIVFDLI